MKQSGNIGNKKLKKINTSLIILGAVLVWILVAVILFMNYVFIGGKLVGKKTEVIDLSGKHVSVSALSKLTSLKEIYLLESDVSIDEYKMLRDALPESYIRWSVPLSSGRYDCESREISISSIREEDIDCIDYFTNLEIITADGIPEWQLLSKLESRYPAVQVNWGIELGGRYYSTDISELKLVGDIAFSELKEKLGAFNALNSITIDGDSLTVDDQLELIREYQYLYFDFPVQLAGKSIRSTAVSLDFSGESDIDLDLLIRCAPLFNKIESIDFSGCGYDNAEMKKVADAYPEADVLWQFSIYDQEVSSLEEEIDFSGKQIADTSEIEGALPYLKNLKKVIMSDCGIDNESMDALNKKYEDIKFVWTVYFGTAYRLRTDETSFIASLYFGSAQSARGDLTDSSIAPLKYCTEMVALDVGHQHFSNVEFCSEMKNLKWLIISQTHVNDLSPLANCHELYFLEMFLCPVEDLSPLLNCTKLRHLNICQCPTASSLSSLAQMTWLERCWMSGGFTYDDRTDRDYVYSDEFLPHTMKRLRGLDHTGDGWRNYPAYYEMRDVLGAYYLPTYWSSNDWRNNPNVVVPEGFIEEHGLDIED